jgi:hypothetical protein
MLNSLLKHFSIWRENSLCKAATLALLFFLISSPQAIAQMSGSIYKIPVDSLNTGGQKSVGGLYGEIDTVGELGSGDSASGNYKLNAGFLAAQVVYIAITANGNVTMTPDISGISGGTGTGSMSWTVTTDNAGGYAMNVHSNTTPSLRSAGSSFADYTRVGSNPDYNWSVASTDSEFGFSPEGTDIVQRFKDNGSACNTGALDSIGHCWDQVTTSDTLIAQRASGNHPSGTLTTVKIQAEVGSGHIQPNGSYTSTILVTALPL